MATTQMLRSGRPMNHVHPPGFTCRSVWRVKCIGKASGLDGEKSLSRDRGDKEKPRAAVRVSAASKNSFIASKEQGVDKGLIDIASLLATVGDALVKVLRHAIKPRSWNLQAQMLIEKAVIDCRFFTLLAVGGSLLGSILCFMEGCLLVLQSYFQCFSSLTHRVDKGQVIQLLIEAIDMFLVGTAMVIFGVGLHAIFVGSRGSKEYGQWLPESNLFGLFCLKALPTWVTVESVSKAKSRIGHAVMMILQVGLLEKFKKVPLVTSLDLACFAGAILLSSTCIFLLSKLSVSGTAGDSR